MKNKIVKLLITIPFIVLWLLCIFEFGSDFIFLTNAKKTSGIVTSIKYETHKYPCDYTEHPAGCGEYTNKYAYVKYKIKGKNYNGKLYLGTQGDVSKTYSNTKQGDQITIYYNNLNKKHILVRKNGLYGGCIVTVIVFLLPFILLYFVRRKKKVDNLEISNDINYNDLIIHKYDDNYAGKNKVNGVSPMTIAVIFGISYVFVVVIYAFLNFNSIIFILITCLFLMIIIINIKKAGYTQIASMASIIEDGNDLYFLEIMPDLRGANFPSTLIATIAGRNAAYAENKVNTEVNASNYAQDNEIVLAWFNDYVNGKIKYDVMYGWPIKVAKFSKKDLVRETKKMRIYKCVWQDKKISKIHIPKCFPTFWN